jgi:hypothetical protein
MEELLTKYLKSAENWDYIVINHYNIDGANCEVVYYTEESKYYRETMNINIWDMLIFLNK